jgi:hypothetical protein
MRDSRPNAKRLSVQACRPCVPAGGYRGWPPRTRTGVARKLHGESHAETQRDRKGHPQMSDGARANPIRHGAFENTPGRSIEGRVQRAARRLFIAAGGRPVSTSEVLVRSYPTAPRPRPHWQYRNARLALRKYGIRIGRSAGHGTPIVWRPNDDLARRIRGDRG